MFNIHNNIKMKINNHYFLKKTQFYYIIITSNKVIIPYLYSKSSFMQKLDLKYN